MTYAYDNLNRLIGEYGYNTEVNPATSVYERLFGYDKAGNRNLMIEHDRDIQYTGWDLDYNDLNQLIYKYTNDGGYGVGGENDKRIAYQYDDNGNLTESHKETHLSGSWSSTLKWDYTWDVRNQMTSASKYVNSSYAGKAEYKYSHAFRGQRTERIEYNASNGIVSWKRFVNDGLLIYRVEERYDANGDGIASNDPWRVTENRSYRPGRISNLLFKEVFDYPEDDSTSGAISKVYYYGYDAVGNVIFVSEDYCGGTRLAYTFMQDAFGNPVSTGVFDGDSWTDAANEGVYEHQTGKEYDTFTQLYYFHHRWYDAQVGRFVSTDPFFEQIEIGRTGGEGLQLLPFSDEIGYYLNPNTLSTNYLFCNNSPTSCYDPDGQHIVITLGIVGGGLLVGLRFIDIGLNQACKYYHGYLLQKVNNIESAWPNLSQQEIDHLGIIRRAMKERMQCKDYNLRHVDPWNPLTWPGLLLPKKRACGCWTCRGWMQSMLVHLEEKYPFTEIVDGATR